MKYFKILFTGISVTVIIFLFLNSGFFRNEARVNKADYTWKLTYQDEFDTFDSTKYFRHFETGNRTIWSNKELQWYMDKNVQAQNSALKITAKRESMYGKDSHGEQQFKFTSGMISGFPGHRQAYGKWEIRCRFPFRKGYWPAFWLVPDQKPTLPEIDVFEYFGIKKNKIWSNHHWGLDYPGSSGGIDPENPAPFYYSSGKETEGDFADVWHVWALEWFPDKLVWKMDDVQIHEATNGIPTSPLYFIINVAVRDWPDNNYEVDDSDEPYIMEVDYLRIYQMVPVR